MAEQKSTFDESQLPEWAVHGSNDQEELDSFFNSPADRGRAETAFAIPRGESDVAESGQDAVSAAADSLADKIAESHETLRTSANEAASASEASAAPVADQQASPGVEQEAFRQNASLEDVSESVFSAEPDAQAVWDAIADTAQQDGVSADALEAEGDAGADAGESGNDDLFGFGKKQDGEDAHAPSREDFATFRCIYESKDGQFALYEDEDGHLTAVNANRFA